MVQMYKQNITNVIMKITVMLMYHNFPKYLHQKYLHHILNILCKRWAHKILTIIIYGLKTTGFRENIMRINTDIKTDRNYNCTGKDVNKI